MQPFSGNQRPDLLTSLMNMSFVLRLPREMHLCRFSSNVPRLPSFLEMLQNPHVLLTFDKVHNPLRRPRKTTSERPKVLRTRQFLTLLTSKCASRSSSVYFFDISTSKSAPSMVCFVHFDLHMCSAPQLTTSKSAPTLVCFVHLTWTCASRQNGVHFLDITTSKNAPALVCFVRFDGVQFFISHLATWLRTRHFSEPTFRPSGATNHWKNTVNRDFPTFFAHLHLLSSHSFSDLLASALPTSPFPSVHIVESLTSKLRSIIIVIHTILYMMMCIYMPIDI